MFQSNKDRQSGSTHRRIAIPNANSLGAVGDLVATTSKRKALCETTGSVTKRVCVPDPTVSGTPTVAKMDMRLTMDHDSHKCVIKMVVKSKLFPFVKFITEGTTDMQYSETEGICAFLLRHCNVAGNSRMWWQTYNRLVRRVVNDHRNNKIKCIQNAYYGTYNCFKMLTTSMIIPNPYTSAALRQNDSPTLDVASCVVSMRSKPNDYESLWLVFGPTVIGTSEWRDHADKCAMTVLLSVSDEAFLLLVLDNYHSRWDAMVTRANDGYTMVCSTT